MNKVMVTGGAGYIGATTLHHLIQAGYAPESLVVVDNFCRGHRDAVARGVSVVEADLRDRAAILKVFQDNAIDNVIHFAGFAYIGESMEDPEAYFRNNFMAGLNVLHAMAETGCGNIVFSSTCATYGIPETMPITEQTPQAPINPYGESKLMFERALRWFKACHGIRHVALRYFNAAGADYGTGARHDPETRIIPLALLAVLGRIPFFQVFGDDYDTPDGTCIRDYVHVTDLAEAHKLALEHLRGGGESLQLNLGTGHGTSVLKVIAAVERITGKDVPYVISPRRAGDPAVLVANSARAEIALGWRTRRDLDDIIRSAWEWRRP